MHLLKIQRNPASYQSNQVFWAAPVIVENKKLYRAEVKRVASEFNFTVLHGNRHLAQQSLFQNLSEQILYSRAVICDVTGLQSANVLIECGVALGFGREVALMGEIAGPIFGPRILNLPADLQGPVHYGYDKGSFARKLEEIFGNLACRPGAKVSEQRARALVAGALRAAAVAGRGLLKGELEKSTGLSSEDCLLARNHLVQMGMVRSDGVSNATRWLWVGEGTALRPSI